MRFIGCAGPKPGVFEQEKATKIDLITVNAVISACANAGQWRWAVNLLQELVNLQLRASVSRLE